MSESPDQIQTAMAPPPGALASTPSSLSSPREPGATTTPMDPIVMAPSDTLATATGPVDQHGTAMASGTPSATLPSRGWRWHALAMAGVLATALALRLPFIWLRPRIDYPDARDYVAIANSILAHGVIHGLTIRRPPLLPLIIAACTWLLGHHDTPPLLILAGFGAGACLACYGLGYELGGKRGALGAGLVSALYLQLVYLSGYLLTEALFTFFLTTALWLCLRLWRRPSVPLALLAGAALGLATLSRPNGEALPLIVLLAAVLAWWPHWRRVLGYGGLLVAVFLLVISPWVARNWYVDHVVTAGTAMDGMVLLGANNPVTFNNRGVIGGDWLEPQDSGLNVLSIFQYQARGLSNLAINDRYRQVALGWIEANPTDFARLTPYKVRRMFVLTQWNQGSTLWNVIDIEYLLVCLLALPAAIWSLRHLRRTSLLWLTVAYTLATTMVFWGDFRMRYPIEPLFALMAGLTLGFINWRLWRHKPLA